MFYLIADLHIGQSLRASLEFENDSYLAVKELTKSILADKQKHKTVILAGDIFGHRRIDGECLQSFQEMMQAFNDAKNIDTIFIQGNHDFNIVPIPKLERCMHIHKQMYQYDDKYVYGLDYMPTEQLKEELKYVPECELLVLHTGFKHLLGFEGAFSLTLEDIPEQVFNVLVGHVHKTDAIELPTVPGGGFCISPGGLQPCAVDQGNEHGYYKTKLLWPLDLEFVKIPTRQIYTWFMFEEESLKETQLLLSNLLMKKHYLKPVVVLNYTANMGGAVHSLEEAYRDKFIFITDIKSSKVDLTLSTSKLSLTDQIKLENALSEAISVKTEPEVYRFLQQLILSDNSYKFMEETIHNALRKEVSQKTVDLF